MKLKSQTSPEVANLSPARRALPRRTFLCRMGLGAVALAPGAALFSSASKAFGDEDDNENENENGITAGDAALLRFPAALEILEADFWIQYNELGGIQDSEVPGGSWHCQHTPKPSKVLDEDMAVYIHDNTDDEITHHQFLNAYLVSKGAGPCESQSVSHPDGQHRDRSQPEQDRETADQPDPANAGYQLVDPLSRQRA